MDKIQLKNLDKSLKYFLIFFLITMTIGIFTGVGYIYYTTNIASDSIAERYSGSNVEINDIPENFPKTLESMLLITHEHLNAFAIISLLIGMIFYFNSITSPKVKLFLMIEPFCSTIITFSSLWLLRYMHNNFAYLIILSSALMYICWISMITISMYELIFKKS